MSWRLGYWWAWNDGETKRRSLSMVITGAPTASATRSRREGDRGYNCKNGRRSSIGASPQDHRHGVSRGKKENDMYT